MIATYDSGEVEQGFKYENILRSQLIREGKIMPVTELKTVTDQFLYKKVELPIGSNQVEFEVCGMKFSDGTVSFTSLTIQHEGNAYRTSYSELLPLVEEDLIWKI